MTFWGDNLTFDMDVGAAAAAEDAGAGAQPTGGSPGGARGVLRQWSVIGTGTRNHYVRVSPIEFILSEDVPLLPYDKGAVF